MSKLSAEEFVRLVSEGVWALAVRLAGNAADAEDLAQDAMARAVKALPGFRDESSPRTWAYRIVVNAWKNRLASGAERLRRAQRPLDAEGVPEVAGGDPPADAALEADERGRAVRAAVAALEPEDRAALQLREFDGMSYEEIAASLDVPVGTVKSRLHRARLALAKALEGFR